MKSWTESGFRTWTEIDSSIKPKLFYYNLIWGEDYQGDLRYSITIHLFHRAFQFTYWR